MKPALPEAVVEVLRALRGAGLRGWVVGGALRAHLVGREAYDFDVVVEAELDRVAAALPGLRRTGGVRPIMIVPRRAGGRWRPGAESGVGEACGTAEAGEAGIEVSGLRAGAGALVGDLERRDFTINAIAWDPLEDRWADPTGGRADLEARVLRSFAPGRNLAADPVRVVRGARFAAELGLSVEARTARALCGYAGRVSNEAAERLRDELWRGLCAERASDWLRLVRDWGVIASAFPELVATALVRAESCGAPALAPGHRDAWQCALAVCDELPRAQPGLRLAALLRHAGLDASRAWRAGARRIVHRNPHLVAARRARELAQRLRLPAAERRALLARLLHAGVLRDPARLERPDVARRVLHCAGVDTLSAVVQLERASLAVCAGGAGAREGTAGTRTGERLQALGRLDEVLAEERERPRTRTPLALGGRDVMELLDVEQGREVGRWLARARRRVLIRPQDNTNARLRAWLLRRAQAASHREEEPACTPS